MDQPYYEESVIDSLDSMVDDAFFELDENIDPLASETTKGSVNDMKYEDNDTTADTLHLCDGCAFQSEELEDFIDHVESNNPHYLKCIKCNTEYPQKAQLKKHYEAEHGQVSNLKCESCRFKCFSKELLYAHKFSTHLSSVYTCITCDKTFKSALDFMWHLKWHGKEIFTLKTGQKVEKVVKVEESINCQTCDYKTHHILNMKRHIAKHHSVRFKCKECYFNGVTKADLLKHTLRIHKKEKRKMVCVNPKDIDPSDTVAYICDKCFAMLPSLELLMSHKEAGH